MSVKSISNCLKCSVLAFSLLFFQPLIGQRPAKTLATQGEYPDLDGVISASEKLLGKEYALQVWKKGDTLVYQKDAGMFNAKTKAPIAAASQWLTAALVMQFVDEGKLSLDDKITRWLPEFEKYGKNYITIRHCLTHQTGIKSDGGGLGRMLSRKKFPSLEEEVNGYAAKEIQANPGTEFRYSQAGPNIAGRVLEIISKKRFDVLIKQRLLTPLKMRNTSFSDLMGQAVNPSAGAVSTVDDYMHFLVMLLDKGSYAGTPVLSENAVNELLGQQVKRETVVFTPKSAEGFSYALGNWVMDTGKDGSPVVLASPGMAGTWPMIDRCRGYAYLLIPKEPREDEKAAVHLAIKKTLENHFPANCDN